MKIDHFTSFVIESTYPIFVADTMNGITLEACHLHPKPSGEDMLTSQFYFKISEY